MPVPETFSCPGDFFQLAHNVFLTCTGIEFRLEWKRFIGMVLTENGPIMTNVLHEPEGYANA